MQRELSRLEVSEVELDVSPRRARRIQDDAECVAIAGPADNVLGAVPFNDEPNTEQVALVDVKV